jgi:hypothetical protein
MCRCHCHPPQSARKSIESACQSLRDAKSNKLYIQRQMMEKLQLQLRKEYTMSMMDLV